MREFEYIPGRIVELVPLERPGYGVGSWKVVQGNVTIVDNKFTMPDEDVRITATYEAILYQLIIEGQNGEQSGAGSYKFEQDVSISAAPNPGYDFDRWEGLELASEANTGFKMPPNNLTITAIYTARKYSVIVNGSNGTQQGSGSEYTVNQNVNIVAEPNTGYRFTEWQVNSGGISAPGSSSDSFSMPANDVEITAIYNLVDYTVQVIGADGGGTYNMGDTVTLSSAPSAGYQFSSWNVITSGSAPLLGLQSGNSFTMPASNVQIEAVYEAKKYTVTINGINGTQTGAGSNYIIGDRVNITATPNTGYNFTEWIVNSGGVSISSGSFDMPDNDVVITAVYTAIEYDVSITGVHGTQSHTGSKYKMGDTVSIQYTPNTGYEFDYWNVIQGGVSVSSNSFVMPASNVSVEIVYGLINYTLTINGVNGTQTGAGSYVMNEEVELQATPSIGWEFDEWQGHTFLNKDSSTTKLTMPASDLTISAVYKIRQFTVTVNGGNGGGAINYGGTVNLTATPDVGYEFVDWTVNLGGIAISSNSFTMPNNDVEVTANFQPKQYTVKVNGGTGDGTKDYDSVVNLVATPDVGYEFVDWTVNSGSIAISSNSFTMPAGNVEVTANFQLKEYTVSLGIYGNGSGTLSGGGTYKMGDSVTVSAAVDQYNTWHDWHGTNSANTFSDITAKSQTFVMPAKDITFNANIRQQTWSLDISRSPTAGGTVQGASSVATYNKIMNIKANPTASYNFSSWTIISGISSIPSPTSMETSFNMPADDVSIQANFVGKPLTLTISTSWLGSLNVRVGSTNYNIPSSSSKTINTRVGESVSISINQGTGHFMYFSGSGQLPPGADVLERWAGYTWGSTWFWIPGLSFTMGTESLSFSASFVRTVEWTGSLSQIISKTRRNHQYAWDYWAGRRGYSNP